MPHDLDNLKLAIDTYLHGKCSNSSKGCYIRKKLVSCIISAENSLINDEIYQHLVNDGVLGAEIGPKKNFPKIAGKVSQKLPFIGSRMNRKVTPNVTEYYFKEAYLPIKYAIREYIENYRCP